VRKHVIGTLVIVASAVLLAFPLVVSSRVQVEAPRVGPQRGRPMEPPQPTPRLVDGTPNLGRVPGEKGFWNVRIVLDFGIRVVGHEVPEAMNRGITTTALGGAPLQP